MTFTRKFIAALALFVLWLLLSGYFKPLLLILGVLSCTLVAWLTHKLDLFGGFFSVLRFNFGLPKLVPWLLLEIIKSSLYVSWRILHPRLPISPTTITVSTTGHGDVAKALYANCITLTPGTYSLNINTDTITAHALTDTLADNLQQGEMSKRIKALESDKDKPASGSARCS